MLLLSSYDFAVRKKLEKDHGGDDASNGKDLYWRHLFVIVHCLFCVLV